MKNIRVAKKLLIVFSGIVALMVASTIVAIISLNNLANLTNESYQTITQPLDFIGRFSIVYGNTRSHIRDLGRVTDPEDNERQAANITTNVEASVYYVRQYYNMISSDIWCQDEYEVVRNLYQGIRDYRDITVNQIIPAGLANQNDRVLEILFTDLAPIGTSIRLDVEYLTGIKTERGTEGAASANEYFASSTTIILIVLVVAVAVAVVFGIYLSKLIGTPLSIIASYLQITANDGDIVVTPEEQAVFDRNRGRRDEVGVVFESLEHVYEWLNGIKDDLSMVAAGNFDIEVNLRSDRDLLAKSIEKIVYDLSSMFGEVNTATEQVASGSQQIAAGSQVLAQGSTEQAATVQQLSASISEIAEKAKDNADMAEQAALLASTIQGNAEKGNSQMDDLVGAVNEISQASQSISKVIKAIDDIAFQTNILALNAAVEAARAGAHGKGFAVVADEVRTLAAKSAEAAKDTGVLISNSMEKAEYGARIAQETADSLGEIVMGISDSNEIIAQIAQASQSQTAGIAQINSGIDQVASVVQQNSATAEESAAAAQELSGQSAMLENLIAQFKLKGSSIGSERPNLVD